MIHLCVSYIHTYRKSKIFSVYFCFHYLIPRPKQTLTIDENSHSFGIWAVMCEFSTTSIDISLMKPKSIFTQIIQLVYLVHETGLSAKCYQPSITYVLLAENFTGRDYFRRSLHKFISIIAQKIIKTAFYTCRFVYAWGAQETPCVWAVLFCFATLHVLLSRDRSGAGDRVGKWLLYNAITPPFFFFKKKTNGWHLLISVCSFNHISLTPLLVSFCLGEDRWEAREKWCFFPPANSCGNRNLLSFSLL